MGEFVSLWFCAICSEIGTETELDDVGRESCDKIGC